jgi:hypothetical protein
LIDIITKNLGTNSVSVGIADRAVSGLITNFTTSPDLAVGGIITIANKSFENVLSAIQDVALQGSIDFEVVWNGSNSWNFNYATPTIATDRSGLVTFSVGNGTIEALSVINDQTVYGTTAIVRGQGTANATIRAVRPSPAPTELASREFFVEAMALGNNITQLNTLGDAKIQEYVKKSRSIIVNVQQTPSNLYGLDYFVGDLVSVDIVSSTIVQQVNQVTISLDENRVETIKVQLENDN